MDFVYATYRRLLDALEKARYRSVTVREAVDQKQPSPLLILRHDVEWNPKRALALAKMDRVYGIRSTFYFRVDTRAYDLDAMRYLQGEGFEVGYHFNTLDRCGGDFPSAIALFETELGRLRDAGVNVVSVKQHGDPRVAKTGYRTNKDIFVRDPELLGRNGIKDADASLKECYPERFYLSDLGIQWNPRATTGEILAGFSELRWPVIYLANHPDYWSRFAVRAIGLQIAAVGLRLFKLNKAVAAARRALAPSSSGTDNGE